MKKYIYTLIASLIFLLPSCSRDDQSMLVTLPDDNPKYAVWMSNLGALIDNKRPHPGKDFNIYFYFNGNDRDPVTKVTLLGKIANTTLAAADRYKDLEVVSTYSPSDWVYSTYFGADSLFISWPIPSDVPATSTSSSTKSAYYRIAVETTRGHRDTTSGDYWGVLLPYDVATLSSILVNGKSTGLSPEFRSNHFSYVCHLAPSVTRVPVVTVTETNASSDVIIVSATSITGTEAERTTTITVISEVGTTTNVYTVTFIKTE